MATLEKQYNLGHFSQNPDLEAPTDLTYPKEIRSGDTIEIYWSGIEDSLGILKGYYLEYCTEYDTKTFHDDYTVFIKLYEGPETRSTLYIEPEWETLLCRVAAIDVDGKRSYIRFMSWGHIQIIQEPKNTAPDAPSSMVVPSTIKGGASIPISWAEAVDAEDNLDGYVLEVSTNKGNSWLEIYNGSSTNFDYSVVYGTENLTFRVKAYDTEGEYSDYYTSNTVTVTNNSPPTTPSGIYVPSTINGGEPIEISWGSSTDSDGNLAGYILEVSTNKGSSWSVIYTGNGLKTNYTVLFGTETLIFRVKAYDSENAQSDYRTSATLSVINNTPPKISGSDSNLGTHTFAFTQSYIVTDDEGGVVSVVEKVDGSTLKSYNVTLGATNTITFSEKDWLKIGNGSHTLTITATDSGGSSATRTYTFTKSETEIYLTYTSPISATEMPTVGVYYITKNIPNGATFSVKVCNNGFDSSPTWEDVTATVNAGGRFYFNNQSKTSSKWGVNAIIEVKRNNAVGDCYISRVQGYFK